MTLIKDYANRIMYWTAYYREPTVENLAMLEAKIEAILIEVIGEHSHNK